MEAIIFSDSHGRCSGLEQVFEAHPDAGMFIHLGDGLREYDEVQMCYPGHTCWGVKGNCDAYGVPGRTLLYERIAGIPVLICHGHLWQVKAGTDRLCREAQRLGAKCVLFGHTHVPCCEYREGILLFNPGSISLPRASSPTYGVLRFENGQVSPEIRAV